jgi:small subunit ribosomal protein S21|tara:strand:- start:731 stop:982 length:252 start_codon:yes stop_codon:yes gene_type:complete
MAENVTVTPRNKFEPFDKMLRRFRNKVERAGIIADVKKNEYFEKPSAKKNRRNQELKRTKLNNKRREAKELHRRKIASNRWGG